MLVVKVYMWPGGDQKREKLLTQATLDLQGIAQQDHGDVQHGERRYRARLLKDTSFSGPGEGVDLNPALLPKSKVWREGMVRGHRPGRGGSAARGTWDLIGGALQVLLGKRLRTYVADEPQAGLPLGKGDGDRQ